MRDDLIKYTTPVKLVNIRTAIKRATIRCYSNMLSLRTCYILCAERTRSSIKAKIIYVNIYIYSYIGVHVYIHNRHSYMHAHSCTTNRHIATAKYACMRMPAAPSIYIWHGMEHNVNGTHIIHALHHACAF